MKRFAAALILGALLVPTANHADEPPRYAGPTSDGFLLPNGWTISPVGRQVPLADLPLNIVPLDKNRALVATSGYNAHELTLVDLETGKKLATEGVRESWFGLAFDEPSGRLWWSGGGGNVLHTYRLRNELKRTGGSEKELVDAMTARLKKGEHRFRTGLAYDRKRNVIYSCSLPTKGDNKSLAWGAAADDKDANMGLLTAIDPAGERAERVTVAGKRPYDVVVARNGQVFVSDWADRCVLAVDPVELRVVKRIPVGEHPNQMLLHPEDDRLFVACASSNCVSVIDVRRGIVTETIVTSLFTKAPEGSTPDALAIDPEGETLYVANADNNCIVVVDIEDRDRSAVRGFIPTGWYPTSVAVTRDGKHLLVGVGKGNATHSNVAADHDRTPSPPVKPGDRKPPYHKVPFMHVGTTLGGALSIVPIPDEEQLAAYTDRVYRNCPYSDAQLSAAPHERKTVVPTKVGEPSPIKHVIYIIKENRTYDQVFGDLPRGNGDPSLVMFGEQITPNHHKLANEFVLLDNLYCNGHVSADGHPWSTMAYNTDYIARNWALTYSKRTGIDDDDEGDLSNAPSGYLWDTCARNGLTYRSYGEYGGRVSQPGGTFVMEGRVPGLVGHVCPKYGLPTSKKKAVRDTDRVAVFLEELAEFEKHDNLPNFIVMSLGEDHTTGTKPGTYTPQACVASNDLALGRLVEAVSKSKYWPKIAIFVIEDDAQNGPDHVDAHRTVGLVISPYVRRGQLDSSQYSTVSMIRTIELLLGLPPLSQFDAAARPMFESFTSEPNLTAYQHEPARIDLDTKNDALAYGAGRSDRMDFSEYDRIDDFELNEILWRAVKGRDAPVPPAVRRAIAYRGAAE
ncbi:MAG TPA: alkaline phosphatase family protein [Pirellulales bacterium]|jgi:YVTN family beta-propeller protein|nr:alkaline phosphatase family protein [Pirellulales bacterium]